MVSPGYVLHLDHIWRSHDGRPIAPLSLIPTLACVADSVGHSCKRGVPFCSVFTGPRFAYCINSCTVPWSETWRLGPVKGLQTKHGLSQHWAGPLQVLLMTHKVVKVAKKSAWMYVFHCCRTVSPKELQKPLEPPSQVRLEAGPLPKGYLILSKDTSIKEEQQSWTTLWQELRLQGKALCDNAGTLSPEVLQTLAPRYSLRLRKLKVKSEAT